MMIKSIYYVKSQKKIMLKHNFSSKIPRVRARFFVYINGRLIYSLKKNPDNFLPSRTAGFMLQNGSVGGH